ncbi:MAG: non-canonical purine NTP pyrophosphatase [Thermoleophilia bacterium]
MIATGNRGKAREFSRLLGGGFNVEALPDTVRLPEETGVTFAENALLKALSVFAALDGIVAVLADDSGLEVDALGGDPGVRSARYAGEAATDEDNVTLLLSRLGDTLDRSGRFVCALAMVVPTKTADVPLVYEFTGELAGSIASAPAGAGGFGYDPVFIPAGWAMTLAEADPGQKDAVSHRARAVAGLLDAVTRGEVVAGG